MRRRFIYDHELGEMVEITSGSNFARDETAHGLQIIRDIEPYRAMGSDVASDGKRPVIGSRSRHRTYLSDNRYVEVGNEKPVSGELPKLSYEDRVNDIRRAMGDFGSRVRD